MRIDWITVGINSGISFILSFMTFALGLRAGKERSDRKDLREKYRTLTIHFQELKDKLIDEKPLNWNDFEEIDGKSMPVVRKMVRNGQHLELRQNLFPELEHLELDVLKYGYYFHHLSLEAGSIVEKVLEDNKIELIKEQYSIRTNVSVDNENSSYIRYNPAKLINKDRIKEVVELVNKNECGINFTYLADSKVQFSIIIRKQDIKEIDFEKILSEIHYKLKQSKNNKIAEKDNLLLRLEKNISKLEQLTREPYPFWFTVFEAIKDIFRK